MSTHNHELKVYIMNKKIVLSKTIFELKSKEQRIIRRIGGKLSSERAHRGIKGIKGKPRAIFTTTI